MRLNQVSEYYLENTFELLPFKYIFMYMFNFEGHTRSNKTTFSPPYINVLERLNNNN